MAMYIKLDGISGSVTTQGYQHWISVQEFYFFGIRNAMANIVGKNQDRITRRPGFGEVHLIKFTDAASVKLFEYAHSGTVIPSAQIHFVTTGNPPFTYQKYDLSKVIISSYEEHQLGHQGQRPTEYINLNYTAISRTYFPVDQQNQPGSPIISGYDLPKAEKL